MVEHISKIKNEIVHSTALSALENYMMLKRYLRTKQIPVDSDSE